MPTLTNEVKERAEQVAGRIEKTAERYREVAEENVIDPLVGRLQQLGKRVGQLANQATEPEKTLLKIGQIDSKIDDIWLIIESMESGSGNGRKKSKSSSSSKKS